jgi:hypothetical protein
MNELAGEAAARAAFRALLEPAGPVSTGTVSHHTLVLPRQAPVPVAGQGPRPPARHRHRRSAARGRGWQVMAAIGSAAAVVAIGVAAFAGAFSGSTVQQRQQSSPTAAQMSTPHGGAGSTPAGVLGNATKDATPSATPKASATPGATASPQAASKGSALCREYFRFDRPVDMATRRKLFRELSRLAGTDSFWGVFRYCTEQQDTHLFTMPPEPTSTGGSWPWLQGDGGGQGSRDGSGGVDSGTGTGQAGSGNATSGPGNTVHGSSDSGSRNSR